MLICHCRAVSDREVKSAIRRGARSMREIAQACGAGSRCGGCRPAVVQLLEQQDRNEARPLRPEPLQLEIAAG